MSILDTLAREHLVFTRLIERLERCARKDDESARRDARDTMLVLLPALDRHAEIADGVSGEDAGLPCLRPPPARRLRALVWTEETLLWPRCARASRSLARSTQRGAAKQVKELERQVVSSWSMIADYLDRP